MCKGLSPRVRGNHRSEAERKNPQRSIPACAGEPPSRDRGLDGTEVYPRVCGGTRRQTARKNRKKGLSPRVRGNRVELPRCPPASRSIPACAGEPAQLTEQRISRAVYPRVCGGTGVNDVFGAAIEGLSPRVRGNRGQTQHFARGQGSIPACAGEPDVTSGSPGSIKVYPRVCGGTHGVAADCLLAHGLSPRVRGNPCQTRISKRCVGSIPACAGEPPAVHSGQAHRRVYPRVCGGTYRRTAAPAHP